ncbi:hypothetical protein J4439_04155 [Candidatus Woesearchaeota archaeon]|nr:hypothetical protein [Candidatus Woesearchaeota archaeon]
MLARLVARWHDIMRRHRRRQLGARLVFPQAPECWLPAFAEIDLTSTWREAGLPVEGSAVLTIGAPTTSGVSARLVRESPLFQGWLGGYLVRAPQSFTHFDDDAPNLNNLFRLLAEDQDSWLGSCGDPEPVTFLVPGSQRLHETEHGTLVEMKVRTHADLGPGNATRKGRLAAHTLHELFCVQNPSVALPENFLDAPQAEKAYETVTMQGYMLLWQHGKLMAIASAFVPAPAFSAMRTELLDSLMSARVL